MGNLGLQKYANIFGKPNEGVHAIRVCGVAVVDAGLSVLLAGIIAKLAGVKFICTLGCVLLLAIGVHYIFGVNTRLNAWLFGKTWP
jgi:hypothetical protein